MIAAAPKAYIGTNKRREKNPNKPHEHVTAEKQKCENVALVGIGWFSVLWRG